ncbi:hypothetical protein EN925_07845 [Mesorhizobium sp. M7A.F.Ca.US.006.04.2.1]|uniref:hypothetical protein n=1 Tax=unclassified Mesorhizobium TaxID=325217 RepID=UPI000FCA81C0|nr:MULTISPECIES: hypothetical protein [unclassified Mesorhizobium]RUX74133.1 hypothetical protein EN990_18940 [Mesorhizobium sp. M7A.F.Ca.US.005.03.1.1]RUY31658.1 hypothetical protein EN979_01850 [Mesorhizobium sp. M7A.F.Ca.US.001.04.2.1]RUY35543.1 hypothetical protein EN978_31950 [Mesorhizobium sp. M7A.F.Ca.US.001.04.1.1]RVA03183.1 hypothetical protein EN938_16905 [Mesorhizobium sp. M7A.F.Ca.US.001.02.1.1]RVA11263.1 hypothetical protein EN932_16520 [Mesorhizobium sp. M7A.F.Ca.US.002.01.1.1]
MTGGYLLAGVWALAILAVFIQAIRLSYRIEARSPDLTNRSGFPRKAMMFHTITNMDVARDAETQSMRRRMNWLLLIVLAGFVVMWAGLYLSRSTG